MKIVLAPDSFKGSLTAFEVVEAAREGVLSWDREASVVALPMADGGEYTMEVLSHHISVHPVYCLCHDALGRLREVGYGVSTDGKTAVMDMASVDGLTLLDETERDPTRTHTLGVGEMMLNAYQNGCRRILLGIGGSSTCDGGMGMLAAFGMRYIDACGKSLTPCGGHLEAVVRLDRTHFDFPRDWEVCVICDVDNPLFGRDGAAYVYAPQKGASPSQTEALDRGLRHWASLFGADSSVAGSGAAGGLGYALLQIGATLRSGVDVVMDVAGLSGALQGADLVVTGEGRADAQTLNGKLPLGVLRRARAQGVPVVLMAGAVADRELLTDAGFQDVVCIHPHGMSDREKMMSRGYAAKRLQETVWQYLETQYGRR